MYAKKATLDESFVKCLVWGIQGSGKTRFALSAPAPLVLDFEGSSRLYAGEFNFFIAEPQTGNQQVGDPVGLTREIVRELIQGEYADRRTLVIDPVTDLLDTVEQQIVGKYEAAIGKQVIELNAIQKTKWYAFRRTHIRLLLDALKNLPMDLILVARAKELWDGGKPTGRFAPDVNPVVPYLMDVVIELRKAKQNRYEASIQKSRLGNLPDVLPVKDYSSITAALNALKALEQPEPGPKPEPKPEPERTPANPDTPFA